MARLSFISLAAYPLLDEAVGGGIGGAEVRAVTFARGLQRLDDHQIEFVVAPHPSLRGSADGIKITPYRKPRGALRAIAKWRHAVTQRIWEQPLADPFYHRLEADVLLCFGLRNDSAAIVRAALESGKKTVLFLTSDRNICDAQRRGRKDRGAYGEIGANCRYALRSANRVVSQTAYQQRALRETLGIESHVIRNPISLANSRRVMTKRRVALWVGRADTFSKRADLCVELARRCPSIKFQMIMNNHDDVTFQALVESAPENVQIVEFVPFAEIERYFINADLLVNTSAAEGFPNSFLQAGKFGKPIVSLTVDPAGMLREGGCGVCCEGDLDRMTIELERLMSDSAAYGTFAQNGYEYVRHLHDAERCTLQLRELIQGLLMHHPSRVA